ncbi:hydantoinase/oxoprolinase family protein [Amycolatopsis taiwanensis]|uniref:Methylhydantoinase n=1 Tax=Amycolatopsis taiwanensis TaxID=342230 RepID=A0A9W6VKJ1_9PSEU|nr:hydantoinase/oxoprolinase family protein [Amycolatopsis taiwanensis]GLY70507.1 methylhydantoinase [Amycolatopsis taiwanensis]
MQVVGVDTGGTFTDTVIISSDGRFGVGKTLSRKADPAAAVLTSVTQAAAALGQTLPDALGACTVFSHGTTIGLNALLTGTGAAVGLLTTRGFESTLPIAKINKVHGLDAESLSEPTRWAKPPLLVPRDRILGIRERVDAHGDILTPLDEEHARGQIDLLAQRGVNAVAISLLWSMLRPEHEQRLAELVRERLPGAHLSLSSELAPRVGEYERTVTTVLNAYVGPLVGGYLDTLTNALRDNGFAGTFVLMRSGGGVQQAHRLAQRSLETLNSGPVGGLSATVHIGRQLGHRNVITTDVGGTSFDVGLVIDGDVQYLRRPLLNRHALAMSVVDILSIGTGGGSLAWVDDTLGALRVGPESMGNDPGPVCYGLGGTRPTVTDAAVVLGYLDRLGGHLRLDRAAAAEAVSKYVAQPLGLDVYAAADGILTVANAQMADLVRRATVRKGHDPRDFALYAFGGAAAQYVGRYADELGCAEAIIPALAAVFSAYGAVASDLSTVAERQFSPVPLGTGASALAEVADVLEAQVRAELAIGDRSIAGELTLVRRAGLRFVNQVNELPVELPPGPINEDLAERLAERFRGDYEQIVGKGTAYAASGVEVVSLAVEGRLSLRTPGAAPPTVPSRNGAEPARSRIAWFDGELGERPVYDRDRLSAGSRVDGPAFIELETTTVVVYPRQRAVVDENGNIRLRTGV